MPTALEFYRLWKRDKKLRLAEAGTNPYRSRRGAKAKGKKLDEALDALIAGCGEKGELPEASLVRVRE